MPNMKEIKLFLQKLWQIQIFENYVGNDNVVRYAKIMIKKVRVNGQPY